MGSNPSDADHFSCPSQFWKCGLGVNPGSCLDRSASRGRDTSCLVPPAQNPHERSLAHAALISDDWRRSVAQDKDGARVEKEATAWQSRSCVPTSPHAFDCDGTERATTC